MAKRTASGGGVTKGQYSFAKVPPVPGQRSVFNRSSNLKTAFNSGILIPIWADEALPGDTLKMRMSSFCRMATPLTPTMDNLYMDFFFFAVPNRLVWDNWHKFCGEQTDPGDSTDYLVPQVTVTPVEDSIYDYFGLPVGGGAVTANSLHFRAYSLIFNEWFRDQNLTDSLVVPTDDGPDDSVDFVLQRRAKRHDYFTSCLPWPQKGDPVALPLRGYADVVGSQAVGDSGIPLFDGVGWTAPRNLEGNSGGVNADFNAIAGAATAAAWDTPELVVDFSTTTAATVNALRQAFQVQRIFERDARAGTRLTEIIRSHFHVESEDSRQQRPEYLGGGTTKIQITPVADTASLTQPLGSLAGFGIQVANNIGFVKSFTEHCVLIGLANVRADITYQEGLERMWSRQTRFDYYWPTLAHLGEQEVLKKELVHTGTSTDDEVFGYQERWAEYRYKPSITTGIMRSVSANSLDVWHLALDFGGAAPNLNNTFIQDNPPISRTITASADSEFLGDFWFNYKCARPMPTYSVPGFIDHF